MNEWRERHIARVTREKSPMGKAPQKERQKKAPGASDASGSRGASLFASGKRPPEAAWGSRARLAPRARFLLPRPPGFGQKHIEAFASHFENPLSGITALPGAGERLASPASASGERRTGRVTREGP